MKSTFSLAFLFCLIFITALGVFAWKSLQPMDHFEIDIAGTLIDRLPADTKLKINANPDHHRREESVIAIGDLPAVIGSYARLGCVAEFWAKNEQQNEQKMFSIAVDREMFDRFRNVTLRLDAPTPQLKPHPDFWATLCWSPNITKRMRYVDLPSWDGNRILPTTLPEMVVTKNSKNVWVETVPLKHQQCQFNYLFGEFADGTQPDVAHKDTLRFSVSYDSGGLFDTIQTSFELRYDVNRHKYLHFKKKR